MNEESDIKFVEEAEGYAKKCIQYVYCIRYFEADQLILLND